MWLARESRCYGWGNMLYNSFCARRMVALCVVLLAGFVCAAQAADAAGAAASSAQAAEAQLSLPLSADQSSIVFPAADSETQAAPRAPSSIWLFIRMILVLAVVIALVYVVLRVMKKTSVVGDTDDPFLRRVCSLSLGQGKSVQVVTVLQHAYLVGVTDAGINLIGEIRDKELVDSMNLFADKNGQIKKPRTFSDVLELFMPNTPRARETAAGFRATAADSLREQRSRLNGDFRGSDE